MPTLAQIKQQVQGLKPAQRRALVTWLQQTVGSEPSDDELMSIAAAGARALDVEEHKAHVRPKAKAR